MKNSLFPVELLLIIHRKLDFDSRAVFETVFGWNRIRHKIVVTDDVLRELNNWVQPPGLVLMTSENQEENSLYKSTDTYFIHFPNGLIRCLRIDKVTRNVLNLIDRYSSRCKNNHLEILVWRK